LLGSAWRATGIKLFIPCFLDQCAPQVADAVLGLLARLGVAGEYPREQTCCGQFAWTTGDVATARRLMRRFLRVFAGDDPILCPSASCTFMVRQCYPQLAEGLKEQRAVAALAARVMELAQWLAGWGPLPWTPSFDGSLVLHQSCKARQLGVLPQAREVLARVQGLELRPISPYYTCCGFGGAFSFQHPGLSRDMGQAYLAAVTATGAAGMVSLDYSCLLHLRGLEVAPARDLLFYHLAELLALGG
jgi:L-lactate dehydrogenase complex protein LldE